jgi:hypothetical protein
MMGVEIKKIKISFNLVIVRFVCEAKLRNPLIKKIRLMLSQSDIISSRFKLYKTQKPWGLTPWLSEPIFPLGMKQTRLREVFLSALLFL